MLRRPTDQRFYGLFLRETCRGSTLPADDLVLLARDDDALRHAASHFQLSVNAVKEKEIWVRASADLMIPIEELHQLVNAIGKSVGPPWTQDQKLAALSGWLALAA
jgi:hypothetical protein